MAAKEWRKVHIFNKFWPYEVSSTGRVRLPGYTDDWYVDREGYVLPVYQHGVDLFDNAGIKWHISVDILVASTFLSNPYRYGLVRHADGYLAHNGLQNLRWCREGASGRGRYGLEAVRQYSVKGKFIEEFQDAYIAAHECKADVHNIIQQCHRIAGSDKGATFYWRYAYDDEFSQRKPESFGEPRKVRQNFIYCERSVSCRDKILFGKSVRQYDMRGHELAVFMSVEEASSVLHLRAEAIRLCCKRKLPYVGSYIFRYVHMDEIQAEGVKQVDVVLDFRQYTPDGLFVTSYKKVTDASHSTGVDATSILECCHREIVNAGGYVWRHRSDDEFYKEGV